MFKNSAKLRTQIIIKIKKNAMRKSRLVIRAHRDHIEIVRTIFLCKVALVDQSWYDMTIFDTVRMCVREIDSEKVRECV